MQWHGTEVPLHWNVQREVISMKKIALLCLTVTGLFMTVGCETPVLSAKERGLAIQRNMGLEWQFMQDDIDNALLLRPVSVLSRWNVR